MALSDEKIVNIWGREPRYHAAPIGSTDIAFARDIEAEVIKQDDALILQLVEALESARVWKCKEIHHMMRESQYTPAILAGRARLEGKP